MWTENMAHERADKLAKSRLGNREVAQAPMKGVANKAIKKEESMQVSQNKTKSRRQESGRARTKHKKTLLCDSGMLTRTRRKQEEERGSTMEVSQSVLLDDDVVVDDVSKILSRLLLSSASHGGSSPLILVIITVMRVACLLGVFPLLCLHVHIDQRDVIYRDRTRHRRRRQGSKHHLRMTRGKRRRGRKNALQHLGKKQMMNEKK